MITELQNYATTEIVFRVSYCWCIQAGGDGCIFVWKVPARVSSKILQKVRENCHTVSPRALVRPVAFKQIVNFEEEDQPRDLSQLEYTNHIEKKEHSHWESSCTTASFKFSVSRLPKWAQDKVTAYDIVPIKLDCISSQVFSHISFSCFIISLSFMFYFVNLCTLLLRFLH